MSLRLGIYSLLPGRSSAGTSGVSEFLHHVGELREQVMGIVGAGRRFRMVLHAEERQILVAQTLVGVIVQVQMCDFDVARRERVGIDTKTVILSGDFDLV